MQHSLQCWWYCLFFCSAGGTVYFGQILLRCFLQKSPARVFTRESITYTQFYTCSSSSYQLWTIKLSATEPCNLWPMVALLKAAHILSKDIQAPSTASKRWWVSKQRRAYQQLPTNSSPVHIRNHQQLVSSSIAGLVPNRREHVFTMMLWNEEDQNCRSAMYLLAVIDRLWSTVRSTVPSMYIYTL